MFRVFAQARLNYSEPITGCCIPTEDPTQEVTIPDDAC